MLKFNSIFIKIKLFYYKFVGVIRKNIDRIEVKDLNLEPNNILIIFPVKEESFRAALYTFRNFEQNNKTNYYYLINRVHHSHFHLNGEIYNLDYFSKKNKIYIDETFTSRIILNTTFDLVIDLNEIFNYDIALLINKLDSNYKIGLKKDFSDWFYNLQFDLNDSEILENGYKKIKLMLS